MKNDNLSPIQKDVLVNKGTEPPFTGALLSNKMDGTYVCGMCGAELFHSDTKYDSGSGWPSFTDVVDSGAVKTIKDTSLGKERVEVVCGSCNGHLGHVFPDGPADKGGQRYCINSASLNFESEDKKTKLRGDGVED